MLKLDSCPFSNCIDYCFDEDYYTGTWEVRKSSQGNIFWVFNKEMPRIKDQILDCSIYLYHSEQDAKQGEKSGGSGFLVVIPSEVDRYGYAVTNSHVIREAASPVIRLNTVNDDIEILNYADRNWFHHPSGDDIAVCPLLLDWSKYKFSCIPTDLFINQAIISKENIGAGDEVFMVGRFIGFDGIQHNTPTLRFGNMSIGSPQKILHRRGYLQESYLIETRSLSGYSGSPVFVHILPFSKRPGTQGWSTERGPWLLGIDWGHEPIWEKVYEKNQKDEVVEGWQVPTNSGIACIVPASKLLELLKIKELVDMRKKLDQTKLEALEKETKQKGSDVVLDSITREQFHSIIKKAAQPIEKPESDSK